MSAINLPYLAYFDEITLIFVRGPVFLKHSIVLVLTAEGPGLGIAGAGLFYRPKALLKYYNKRKGNKNVFMCGDGGWAVFTNGLFVR